MVFFWATDDMDLHGCGVLVSAGIFLTTNGHEFTRMKGGDIRVHWCLFVV